MEEPFEILEHTADVGFRVRGGSVAELFENAARALASFTLEDGGGAAVRVVELRGEDYESLLVNWLSEVLYLLDTGQFKPRQFQVESIRPDHLRARLTGGAGPAQWRLIVKAVTYHQIEVKEKDGRWEATVYLDV